MKGVILAGGQGQRLRPLTTGVNKHLLPVGDVPMVVHPLRRLVEANIDDILIVSSPEGVGQLALALGSGQEHGATLSFRVQDQPGGIADALRVAAPACAGGPVCVILGDNVFDGALAEHRRAFEASGGALVLLYRVPDPERYGVARLEGDRISEIVEKPAEPVSDLAVTGVYFYDQQLSELLGGLSPSERGELEVTDLNNAYIARGQLRWRELSGRWIDAGTLAAYREAGRLFAGG